MPRGWGLAAVIATATAARLVFAATTELTADEAYYVAWSERLAVGYFDHPPAVAWLIAAGVAVVGRSELGVRLPAALCTALATWLLAATVRALGGDRRGALLAAAALSASPLGFTAGAVMTPDAPLLAAWAAALWCGTRALAGGGVRWWVATGVACGAAVLGKLTGLVLLVAAAVAVVCTGAHHAPGPWLGLLAAALTTAPFWHWSAGHAWLPLSFQTSRLAAAWAPHHLPELVAGQLALLTPATFAVALWGLRRPPPGAAPRLAWWSAVLPLLLLTALAMTRRVEANWPGAAWLGALACACATPRRPWFARPVWTVGLPATLTFAAMLQAWTAALPLGPTDPTARLRGHRALAAAVAVATDAPLVLAPSYQTTSLLRFYLPPGRVAWASGTSWRRSQYDLWRAPHADRVAAVDDAGRLVPIPPRAPP